MNIYVLMQYYKSQIQSTTIPIKAFKDFNQAQEALEKYNSSLELFKGLRLAYQRLIDDWLKRNSENPDISKSLEKESERLIKILELDFILEEHGILIEDELPNYYLVEVELL